MRNYFKLRFSKAHWRTFCRSHFINLLLSTIGFLLCAIIFTYCVSAKTTFENCIITKKYESIGDNKDNITYHIVFVFEGKKYDATINQDRYKSLHLGKQALTLSRFSYDDLYGIVGVCCFFDAFGLILLSSIFLVRLSRQIIYYRECIWYKPNYDKF